MLMVVFGAGASMDSVNPRVAETGLGQAELRPPLASELFADRSAFGDYVERYADAASLIYELRVLGETDGGTVEDELQRFENEAQEFPRRHAQLAAVLFYLRSVVSLCADRWSALARHVTNYRRLVDFVEAWRYLSGVPVSYVTFNYDTMLEDACAWEMDTRFHNIGSYIERPDFSVFKVHGSVNWGRAILETPWLNRETAVPNPHATMIARAANLPLTDDYAVLDNSEVFWDEQRQQFMFPALAVPLKHKRQFLMPSNHEAALIKDLPSVSVLLVIGWAAADRHLLDLFAEHGCNPARTLIVAGSDVAGREPASRLAECGLNRNVHIADGGFSDLLTRDLGLLRDLLAIRR